MEVIERLATQTDYLGKSIKHSIIEGYLNLPMLIEMVTQNALGEVSK